MTKEEVLQKANDYCSKKDYTNETLTDDFKERFSEFFAKKHAETDSEDESMIADLQFNLDTAFSATSKGITSKQKAFDERENSYKNQIAELKKNQQTQREGQATQTTELPDEVKKQLEELEKFKNASRKSEKLKEIIALAKKNVRSDLHKSFESYAVDFAVNVDEDSESQAKKLTARFQDIFKDTIGDTKPLAPKQKIQADMDLINSVKKITL